MQSSYAPPLPPDVLRQQAASDPPALRFIQRAGQLGASQGAAPNPADVNAVVKDRMGQVVVLLKEVFDLISVAKPAALPYLQVMVRAGGKLMQEIDGGAGPEVAGPTDGSATVADGQPRMA